jgi:hypothetical protein
VVRGYQIRQHLNRLALRGGSATRSELLLGLLSRTTVPAIRRYTAWAVAPYEASYPLKGSVVQPKVAVVFFQGWSDQMVPDAEGPLNTLQWEGCVLEGNLSWLGSILTVPKEKGGK